MINSFTYFSFADIWKTVPDSQTKTKQNLRFQEGICPEKCQIYHIQNGRLAAIIDFNMCNILKTMSARFIPLLKHSFTGLR